MAQPETLLHDVASEVDVAILQTVLFADFFVVVERRCLGGVQDRQFPGQHFDATGRQVRIDRAFRSRTHKSFDGQHIFIAHAFGCCKEFRCVRVADDLQQAVAVAQIDENHATVVAAAVHPAGNGDLLADQRLVDLTAVVAAHPETVQTGFKKGAEW